MGMRGKGMMREGICHFRSHDQRRSEEMTLENRSKWSGERAMETSRGRHCRQRKQAQTTLDSSKEANMAAVK